MENIDDKTVAEIVTENIKTSDVFKKNGIDFCCGGNIKIQDVCKKNGLEYNLLKKELENINRSSSSTHDYYSWDLDFLVDFIMYTHHRYIVNANDLIIQYSDKVANVHGHHYSEVKEINSLFHSLTTELISHMNKEENILFPYIRRLATANRNGLAIEPAPFGTIQNPINMMEEEHVGAGDIINKITELSNQFTPPDDACNTFRALYAKLEEYQDDLFRHIHLENNILFPRAIQLEKALSI